jgi:hypothetical protein
MAETVTLNINREELKAIIREAVQEAMREFRDDDGNLSPEIVERLLGYKAERPRLIPAEEVARELELDV